VSSIKLPLFRGSLWLGLARTIVNLIGFCSTLVLARLLTPADFGLVALATVLLTVLSSVTNLSLASALIHLEDPGKEHFHTAWTLNFGRSILVAIVFAGLSYPAAAIYAEPRLIPIMLVLAGTIVMGGLGNPRIVLFSKSLIFWQEFVLATSAKLLSFIAAAVVAILYHSYWALVVGSVAAQLTSIAVSYICIPYRPKICWTKARELWFFSIWLTLGQILNTLHFRLDYLLIGGFLGRPALGYYTVGNDLSTMPTREATAPLMQTLFPGFAILTSDRPRLREAFKSAQSLVFCIAIPFGFGFALVADPLVRLVMGEKWLPATIVIQVLACVFALQTLTTPVQPLALALGETRRLFQRDLFVFLVRVPLVLAGMLLAGLSGIIYARIVSGTIGILANLQLGHRLIGVPMRSQLIANQRSLLSLAAMVAAVLGVRSQLSRTDDPVHLVLTIAALIATGAAIYVGVHAALWLAAGRPLGPERQILAILALLLKKAAIGEKQ
jgi:O-antigen/teichoic acid export membrane protein